MNASEWNGAREQIARGAAYTLREGVGVFALPSFSAVPGIAHGFSSRVGGVSDGCYASLNLSFSRPDDPDRVRENYRIFASAMGFDAETMVMDSYAHGTVVRRVDKSDCGRGWSREPLPTCDGLVTNDTGVTLVTGHADCMAFFCYDPVHRAIGLAHAGWRGTLNRIGKNLIETMTASFGSDPACLLLGVGPSICPDCFEVGEDVAKQFADAFPGLPCILPGAPGKAHVDLWAVACCQFIEAGANPAHITVSGVCTYEERDKLYSHRRDRGETGGMAAFLRLC